MEPVAVGLFVGVPLACAVFILLLSRRPITVFVKEGSRTLTVVGDEIVRTSYDGEDPAPPPAKWQRGRTATKAVSRAAAAAGAAAAAAGRRVSPARAARRVGDRLADRRVKQAFESAFDPGDRGELASQFRRALWEEQMAGAPDLYFLSGEGLRFALRESLEAVLSDLAEAATQVTAILPPDHSGRMRISFDDGCELTLTPWDRAAGRLLSGQTWHGPVTLSTFEVISAGGEHGELRLIFDTVEGPLPLRARQLALA